MAPNLGLFVHKENIPMNCVFKSSGFASRTLARTDLTSSLFTSQHELPRPGGLRLPYPHSPCSTKASPAHRGEEDSLGSRWIMLRARCRFSPTAGLQRPLPSRWQALMCCRLGISTFYIPPKQKGFLAEGAPAGTAGRRKDWAVFLAQSSRAQWEKKAFFTLGRTFQERACIATATKQNPYGFLRSLGLPSNLLTLQNIFVWWVYRGILFDV